MPAVQTTYNETMRQAVAGMIADMSPQTIVSRFVEGSAGLAFGAVAVQGTADNQVTKAAAGAAFVGIAVLDPTRITATPPASVDQYQEGHMASILLQGTIWVTAGAAVKAGDAAYFVPATGVITNVATGNTAIPNARFDTSAASGALAKLRLV